MYSKTMSETKLETKERNLALYVKGYRFDLRGKLKTNLMLTKHPDAN